MQTLMTYCMVTSFIDFLIQMINAEEYQQSSLTVYKVINKKSTQFPLVVKSWNVKVTVEALGLT